MKRSLILLGISTLSLLLVLVSQAYAGTRPCALSVLPHTEYIVLSNRRADWQWYPKATCDCLGGTRVSVRQWTGQHSWEYNNFPNKIQCRWYSSYWYYDSYSPPVTYYVKWYAETGNAWDPAYYMFWTYVIGLY